LPFIGVDIAGQVGSDPPVYCVAVKRSRRAKQTHRVVCVSKQKHEEYAGCTRNWNEKLSSILIYWAVVDIYTSIDVIVIDVDFEEKRRKYVERCLNRLFGERFFGQSPLSDPNIMFAPAQFNENVKTADVKSKMARHRNMPSDWKDPDFSREFSWLSNL